ncbi:TPA: nitrilase-related carbon-nitrogen hydrolase [Yersinia enterocolitica]|uniref:Nitrilase n=1 Tax=Yersinia enterocolitica TaxID=630 RepID=A0A7T9XRN1_YEREN|nr:nitrilase-related carbon-nitrogen hydrolase [Yersinia enterocolitica]QQU45832.1 nitrilase [Yersinia enterocolitica]CFW68157.1 aliphatic amidase amiE [Yersinia enterocolitica]CND78103.1 aliphatic amidase amiE [Yersinia enterocolitica]CNG12755.1 aliphatic amidase amiE [Yersinia enterocolitica]CNH58047.1 aliphatic amidase amiE [Yersinia enterocolitica]
MSIAPYLAAAIQFEPLMFAKEANLHQLLVLVEQAAQKGARLITTPEMATTGYCWFDRQEIAPMVETVPGESTARFTELAQRYQCYIVLGMPEVEPQTALYYNSAVLIGPQGVIGCHRKSHPYISEPKWAAAGDVGHQVFDTPLGRIGMLVCMDIHFPETTRLLALDGIDVICHISNWLAERTPAPYWISRAMENGCYLLESNRWGLERGVQFSGGSCIIEPDGNIAAVVDNGDGIAYAEIDINRSRQRRVLGELVFDQRRPDYYQSLLSDSFLWNPQDFFGLYGQQPLPPGKQSRITVVQSYPIPTGADPLHWHLFRTRAGENNLYLAFANAIDDSNERGGYSGIFGPETFTFPRHERLLWQETQTVTQTIDTRSLAGSPYPTNVVRRKDLVAMRQPHHYKPLLK